MPAAVALSPHLVFLLHKCSLAVNVCTISEMVREDKSAANRRTVALQWLARVCQACRGMAARFDPLHPVSHFPLSPLIENRVARVNSFMLERRKPLLAQ